jgi:pSer/pThr/pTyr-binding forkhead associated (FHA) protein
MDPTWSRCPQCLKEGREGRLITPGAGMPRTGTDVNRPAPPMIESAPVAQAPAAPPPAPVPSPPATEMPPAEPPREAEPAGYRYPPPEPPRNTAEQTPPVSSAPPPARPGGVDRPQSSVGQTFVIRRRPRVLAYLIEKEGEQVGRVYQLEDDVTDIGRDPRNHVVVTDVMVSAFHARVERGSDGVFMVMDRGSSNGSRLNGDPLTSPHPFNENDEVGFGSTTLVLKVVG